MYMYLYQTVAGKASLTGSTQYSFKLKSKALHTKVMHDRLVIIAHRWNIHFFIGDSLSFYNNLSVFDLLVVKSEMHPLVLTTRR